MNSKRWLLLAVAALAVWYFFFRGKDGKGNPLANLLTPRPSTAGNNVNPITNANANNPFLQGAAANNALNKGTGSGNGLDANALNAALKGGAALINSIFGGSAKPVNNTGSSAPWLDPRINPPDSNAYTGPIYGPTWQGEGLPTYGPVYEPPTSTGNTYQFGAIRSDDTRETASFDFFGVPTGEESE